MSLTDLAYYLRKYLPFTVVFFLLVLIFYYSLKLYLIYSANNKPTTLYLNPIFGKIKKPVIKNTISGKNLSFTLDTIEGKPVTSTTSAKIFFLPAANTRFGYREKIYLIAKTFGFNIEEVKHNLNNETKEASFKDPSQELTIDITNFNFSYAYDYENNPQIFENSVILPPKEIENKAVNILTSIGRYPEELSQGKIAIQYLYFDPNTKKVNTISESSKANMVQVDFSRSDIEGYAVIAPPYLSSQNYIWLTFNYEGHKVLKAQIRFFEKSEGQIGIYPLKNGEEAWQEIATGSAMIVSIAPEQKNILIKKMFLAYLDPDVYQEYLQPVYVFLGDANFISYIPAVRSDFLED